MKEPSYGHFRGCISTADARHIETALIRGKVVHLSIPRIDREVFDADRLHALQEEDG
jgi:hypothetical protein